MLTVQKKKKDQMGHESRRRRTSSQSNQEERVSESQKARPGGSRSDSNEKLGSQMFSRMGTDWGKLQMSLEVPSGSTNYKLESSSVERLRAS